MIQLFKPVYRTEEVLEELRDTLNSGWTGIGGKCVNFEQAFKNYTGLHHAHFLNSATGGLHLALEIIKHRLKPNDPYHVATTPLTFISTNHAIFMSHWLRPTFVDIDSTLCMDPLKLAKVLNLNQVSAVIFVLIGGNPGQLFAVQEICKHYQVPLILDASHALGSHLRHEHIGKGADFTIFSTQAVKNLSTGDGGFICCKRDEDDKLARKLSWLGISKPTHLRSTWDYEIDEVGWKYHGNAIAASIGLVGLKYVNGDNYRRREIKNRYDEGLNPQFLETIPNPRYITDLSSCHLYQVAVPANKRDKIIEYSKNQGVQLGVHYRINTDYPMYSYGKETCPVAEDYSKRLISLPIGIHLSNDDVNRVIEVVNDAYSLA